MCHVLTNIWVTSWKQQFGFHVWKVIQFRKRKNYLTPDPTILHTNESSEAKTQIVGLMKNGYLDHVAYKVSR